MSKRYVLCLTAANRTGILAAITTALSELGGDIHEIGQGHVKNFAALILTADFPEHRDPQVIVSHVQGVCRPFGVDLILKDPQHETPADEALSHRQLYVLTLTGRDAPGIVAKISGRLAREGIDITDVTGTRRDDGRSFALALELAIPAGVDVALLQSELVEPGAGLDISARLVRSMNSAAAGDS